MQSVVLKDYVRVRDAFLTWREDSSLSARLGLAFLMAAATGLMAQIAIALPWTPVPITGQTLAVLLSGVVLGRKWGGVSQALYIGLGSLGLPWFAGLSGGGAILFGPTAGYLLGFILAALFLGAMTGSHRENGFFTMVGLMWFASFVFIQVPGLVGLALWHKLTLGHVPAFSDLLGMGLLPFVPGDVVKILLAAGLARAFTFSGPSQSLSK